MFNDNTTTLDRSNFMNTEISKRNIPSGFIQPYIDIKPVSTKFMVMPSHNLRNPSFFGLEEGKKQITTEGVNGTTVFNIEHTFNPGNKKPPNWANYVNVESELRNQIFALQKGERHVYVPEHTSSLYYHNFKNNNVQNQPHEKLFITESFENFNPNPHNLGFQIFNNNTRVQLKEAKPQNQKKNENGNGNGNNLPTQR